MSFKDLTEGQLNGLIRLQIRYDEYTKAFCDGDTRSDASMTAVYQKLPDGTVKYIAPFLYKYQGKFYLMELLNVALNDYPQSTDMPTVCYCFLRLKVLLGEDPTAEIFQVRERALERIL
ncbi:RagB/SusD family nutrient uptake outer membrane protein [Bacteroides fragilis]|nr:RagB/SusD family nutrient uptake outer membrane protein [Bacteroides fragilis]